ncbi:MAG TPA: hypothetical protein VL346_04470, partial [Acidobacteriaceae bacterium]|nr:hypothetical protein [Acidobacteriaceae bacterium]
PKAGAPLFFYNSFQLGKSIGAPQAVFGEICAGGGECVDTSRVAKDGCVQRIRVRLFAQWVI